MKIFSLITMLLIAGMAAVDSNAYPFKPERSDQLAREANSVQAVFSSARKYGIDPLLWHAVIESESAYRPDALSSKGAAGLAQLMPQTARRFQVKNPASAWDSAHGGAAYFRMLLDRYGDVILAIAAYNAGEAAVDHWHGVPPFAETRVYVRKVLYTWMLYRTAANIMNDGTADSRPLAER